MRTRCMKWVSIAVLLLAVGFWRYAGTYETAFKGVVSVAAAVVLIQAFQQSKYVWTGVFLALALLFNPVLPIFRLTGGLSLILVALSILLFAVSLVAIRSRPLMSIPSITDRNPGSESL